jgi:hypothetical protein
MNTFLTCKSVLSNMRSEANGATSIGGEVVERAGVEEQLDCGARPRLIAVVAFSFLIERRKVCLNIARAGTLSRNRQRNGIWNRG